MTPSGTAWRRAAPLAALAAAALAFLPAGASGLAALAWLGLSLAGLLTGAWTVRREGLPWLLAWAGWMLCSAAWTVAPAADWPRHASHVAILVTVPVMAGSLAPRDAARALRVFVLAAAALALLWLWHHHRPLPTGERWSSLVHYTGNKGIANGLLMALAGALALHFGFVAAGARRALWGLLAALLVASVLWKSASRTAHAAALLLPLVLLAWHVAQRLAERRKRGGTGWAGPALAGGGTLAALLAGLWWFGAFEGAHSPGGIGGVGGLAAREAAGQLQQSDDSRRVLYAATLAMVEARPWAGHGLGAWGTRWQQAVDRGEAPAAMRGFNTAHSAPLQLLAEGGGVALALLLMVLWAWVSTARRAAGGGLAGCGAPLGLVLLAFGGASLVNAVLRDAVFSSPMAVLLALALAAAGKTPPPR